MGEPGDHLSAPSGEFIEGHPSSHRDGQAASARELRFCLGDRSPSLLYAEEVKGKQELAKFMRNASMLVLTNAQIGADLECRCM